MKREKKTEGRIGKRKIRHSENGERKLRGKIRKKEKEKNKLRNNRKKARDGKESNGRIEFCKCY